MNLLPNYNFYPTLLDSFQRYLDADADNYFYKDSTGWHRNYNDVEGTYKYSQEEVERFLMLDLIDTINKVDGEVSEAASKGKAFNEVIDCIIHNQPCEKDDMLIKTVNELWIGEGENRKKIQQRAIYALCDDFEFYFDVDLCKGLGNYYKGSLSQLHTTALLPTAYGTVRLYGYVDELNRDKVFDLKTTKSYEFGNYRKYWQRHVYPYCLVESGNCSEISSFEFTVVKWKKIRNTPIFGGECYREVYDYDHSASSQALRQHCERFIEFVESHRDEIYDKKIFGL